MGDYRRSFALFPPIYLAMFLIRQATLHPSSFLAACLPWCCCWGPGSRGSAALKTVHPLPRQRCFCVHCRGVCILCFNPLFHLLGGQALPLRAVAFATWGGLR